MGNAISFLNFNNVVHLLTDKVTIGWKLVSHGILPPLQSRHYNMLLRMRRSIVYACMFKDQEVFT